MAQIRFMEMEGPSVVVFTYEGSAWLLLLVAAPLPLLVPLLSPHKHNHIVRPPPWLAWPCVGVVWVRTCLLACLCPCRLCMMPLSAPRSPTCTPGPQHITGAKRWAQMGEHHWEGGGPTRCGVAVPPSCLLSCGVGVSWKGEGTTDTSFAEAGAGGDTSGSGGDGGAGAWL